MSKSESHSKSGSKSSYETVRSDPKPDSKPVPKKNKSKKNKSAKKAPEKNSYTGFVETIDPANVDPKDFIKSYDPVCVQNFGNFGSSNGRFLFTHKNHEPLTRENLKVYSPKLLKIIEEIERQDESDMQKYGKKFKHFIFSTVKSGNGGAKMIATALIDILHMYIGYYAERKTNKEINAELDEETNKIVAKLKELKDQEESEKAVEEEKATQEKAAQEKAEEEESSHSGGAEKIWKKINLRSEEDLLNSKYNNFFLLCSGGVFQQPLSVSMRKEMLRIFNSRKSEDTGDEGNSYGEKARIMVMDGGFKEGIDLFDIKYIHIFEPQTTLADQKQAIGRGTRLCGQKGLVFHPTNGWDLHVNIYDSILPEETRPMLHNSRTVFNLYMSSLGIDIRLINLTVDMERVCVEGSVDYKLNNSIHSFKIGNTGLSSPSSKSEEANRAAIASDSANDAEEYQRMRKYIDDNFSQYKWENIKMENMCGGAPTIVKYTPTQDFIRNYFRPSNPCKGMLLYNSVGTGKTCTAIATATSTFEKEGYTILWVTRTTLKNDIWKNMFDQVCSISIRDKIEDGVKIPDIQREKMRLLSKAWSIRPMSYKQFSNLVSGQNAMYKALVKRNGEVDPLRKTLIIIDEAHKLYGDSGLSTLEQPDMGKFYEGLMKSYEISGPDSCRLLLMTATPITKSPMEMVNLLNLCKERHHRIEDNFELFSSIYLDKDGYFTREGRTRFLNEISGYISYLNREKDARSFAQPIIKFVEVNIMDTPLYKEYDARIVRQLLKTDLELKQKELELAQKVDKSSGINSKTISIVDKVCSNYEKPLLSKCKKIVSTAKKSVLKFVKDRKKTVKQRLKDIKNELKNVKSDHKDIVNKIIENVKDEKVILQEEKNNPQPVEKRPRPVFAPPKAAASPAQVVSPKAAASPAQVA